jgi:histone H3/H4
VLIIASRLKDFVRDEAQFNTSADVMEALSTIVRDATRDAIARARVEGRRTVMARDFRR